MKSFVRGCRTGLYCALCPRPGDVNLATRASHANPLINAYLSALKEQQAAHTTASAIRSSAYLSQFEYHSKWQVHTLIKYSTVRNEHGDQGNCWARCLEWECIRYMVYHGSDHYPSPICIYSADWV